METLPVRAPRRRTPEPPGALWRRRKLNNQKHSARDQVRTGRAEKRAETCPRSISDASVPNRAHLTQNIPACSDSRKSRVSAEARPSAQRFFRGHRVERCRCPPNPCRRANAASSRRRSSPSLCFVSAHSSTPWPAGSLRPLFGDHGTMIERPVVLLSMSPILAPAHFQLPGAATT